MSKAIVCLATNRGNYVKGLARLEESLKSNFDGDFFGFVGEHSVGAPKHLDNPYAFKVYAIDKVREQGYDQIMWLDASVYAIRNVQPCFDEIENSGFLMQEAGQMVGTWCNDRTLSYFRIKRDDAMKMPCFGNAGMLGLDFSNPHAEHFFGCLKQAMEAGMFKGAWNNDQQTESDDERCKGHRHDMTCGSIIANQMGLVPLFKKGDEWLQYAGPYDQTANDTIIFKAQGL